MRAANGLKEFGFEFRRISFGIEFADADEPDELVAVRELHCFAGMDFIHEFPEQRFGLGDGQSFHAQN